MSYKRVYNIPQEAPPAGMKPMTEMKIPDQCFRYRSAEEQISTETQTVTPLIKIEWNKGIFQYLQGAEYPMKGLTSAETMWALNGAKRNFIEGLRLFSKWYFWPGYVILAVLPWKYKKKAIEQFIHSYCETSWRPISPFMLKNEYQTVVAQELEWVVYKFLDNLGIKHDLCDKFAEIFASLIEYDTAYRYRVQDLFAEADKGQLIRHPRKEVKRLLSISASREFYLSAIGMLPTNVDKKLKVIVNILSFVLLIPRVKKSFTAAVGEIDVSRMGFDEADKYWVCFREDYKFFGKTIEERKEMIKDLSKPDLIKL